MMMDKEMICGAFEQMVHDDLVKMIEKGDISPSDVENATKAFKLLDKMKCHFEDYPEEIGYSGRRAYYPMNSYYGSMKGMRDGRGMMYPRGDYSRHGNEGSVLDRLEMMKDQAMTDQERMAIENAIENMR